MVDVVIVGAGPYGLSFASHLQAKGVRFRIFGKPIDSWKTGMPPGMRLKSHAWSSNLSDPRSELTLRSFCAEKGVPLGDADTPPLELFVAYAEAFQKRLVPNVETKLLTRLKSDGNGFQVELEDGEVVTAKKVVLAVGVHPFKYVPDALRRLPSDALSHSADHGPLDRFSGKTVAVIGAGSSATDLAALLPEKGAFVSLIARAPKLKFSEKVRRRKSIWRGAASLLKPVIQPGSGIGSGWLLKFCADAPSLFHLLPQRLRTQIVGSQLGPLGHSAMKERVVGKLPLFLGSDLEAAEFVDGKVNLHLRRNNGKELVRVDHVIAATGYKIDVSRLGFLDKDLLSRIVTTNGAPVLSIDYESSAPGLYFVGPASANAFGPVMRFVFGADHASRRLAAHLAKRERNRREAVNLGSLADQLGGQSG